MLLVLLLLPLLSFSTVSGHPVPTSFLPAGSSLSPGTTGAHAPRPAGPHAPAGNCPVTSLAPRLARVGSSSPTEAGVYSAHSVDPSAVPNSGFEYNVTGYSLPATSPEGNGTFELDEQESIADQILLMGFIGIENETGTAPYPFWAVLANQTGKVLNCGYLAAIPPPGAVLPFVAQNVGGRTWTVTYRGATFDGSNNITMNGTQATWTGGIGVVSVASWAGTPWVPSVVTLPWTMRVFTSNGWYLPHPVASSWDGTVSPAWGEAGTAQEGYLAPGELQVGTSIAPVANGTELWTSAAPTPLAVTLNASSTALAGGEISEIVLRATADGVPIAGLGATVSASAGGTFSPAVPWTTDAAGVAIGNFTAPLVSVLTTENLSATVGNGLYQGFATRELTVAPTTLLVSVSISRSVVGPSGLVNVTLRTMLGGVGVPGVNLTLSADVGGGAFSPLAPWVTGSRGYLNGTYEAPSATGAVRLFFQVEKTGYSGSATVWLNVSGPSVTSGSGTLSEEETVGAVAVVVVVLLAALLVSLRRRRAEPAVAPAPPNEEGSEAESPAETAEEEDSAPEEPTAKVPAAEAKGPPTEVVCAGCGRAREEGDGRFCPACGAPYQVSERRKAIGPAA